MHEPTPSLQALQDQFGRGQIVRFDAGRNGLPKALIHTPHAAAEIYLHGAHVTAYQPVNQQPVLFLSRQSWFAAGKPIRGGVPICFPWFADEIPAPDAPMHGFARLMDWRVQSVTTGADGAATISFALCGTPATRRLWPHEFDATFRVTIGRALMMRLQVTNLDQRSFSFTQALHTYLAVGDVARVRVSGLERTDYLDKLAARALVCEGDGPIEIRAETDRIYLGTAATCAVDDPVLGRRLLVSKAGSRSTVLWNPWVDKAQRMPDFGDDEWPRMLCIETCNVADDAVTLAPGQSHALEAEVTSQLL